MVSKFQDAVYPFSEAQNRGTGCITVQRQAHQEDADGGHRRTQDTADNQHANPTALGLGCAVFAAKIQSVKPKTLTKRIPHLNLNPDPRQETMKAATLI